MSMADLDQCQMSGRAMIFIADQLVHVPLYFVRYIVLDVYKYLSFASRTTFNDASGIWMFEASPGQSVGDGGWVPEFEIPPPSRMKEASVVVVGVSSQPAPRLSFCTLLATKSSTLLCTTRATFRSSVCRFTRTNYWNKMISIAAAAALAAVVPAIMAQPQPLMINSL